VGHRASLAAARAASTAFRAGTPLRAALYTSRRLNQRPWIVAALASWGIAFFEYMLQVPGNRIGYTVLSIGQLKLIQEVITLVVFVPFAVYYLKEPLKLDYLWAALCILGAVYFVFRSRLAGA
jgi:uncharacterized protein (DUF486 family)